MPTSVAGEPLEIDRDLSCVVCAYNLRTLHVSAACPECGHTVAETLRAELSRAALPALTGMREVVDTLAGLPLIVLASAIPVLILLTIPVVSPWALIGLPAGTGGVCLFLYVAYGWTFLTSAKAYLPRPARGDERAVRGAVIAAVAALVVFLAITVQSASLGLSFLLFGGGVLVVVWVVLYARRLAARTHRADIVRLATATIIAGCLAEASVLISALYFVRATRELVAPVVGSLSIIGLSGRSVFVVAPLCLGVFLALAALVMFRLRSVLDKLIADASRGRATAL